MERETQRQSNREREGVADASSNSVDIVFLHLLGWLHIYFVWLE